MNRGYTWLIEKFPMNPLIKKIFKTPVHYFYTGEKYLKSCSRNLQPFYNERDTSSPFQSETVICMFDGKIAHGGLADRLKGIISMYFYSKLYHYNFKIYHKHPFDLSLFLVPNKYDWKISTSELCFNSKVSVPIFVTYANYFFEDRLIMNYLRKNIHGYKQYHVYPSLQIGDKHFSTLFHELFKPSPLLQNEIDKVLKDINGKFITMSFRFVQLLGDFKDTIPTILPEDEQERLIQTCLDAIDRIRLKAPFHDKVVVTSDSKKFLERVKVKSFVYLIPGKVGHIDYSSDMDVHLKTFVDFLTIAHAEKAYMVRTTQMYRSGFAQHACMINNTPYEEFEIKESR